MSELIVLRCATRRVLTKSFLPLRSADGLSVEWVFLLFLLRRDGKCDCLPLPRACPVEGPRCGLAFLSALRRSSPNALLRVAVFLNDEGDVAATGNMGALVELFIGGGCEGGCGTANSFKRSIGESTASALLLLVSGAKPHSVRSSCANSTGKLGALELNPRLFGGPLFADGEFGSNIELGSNVGANVGDPMLVLESESGVSGDFKLEI